MNAEKAANLARKDDRIILHVDYSAFYATVFENENPALRSLPLAVQQKHIIVTCNYEARRRGLHKLQLISEARKLCPDVVIVSGEKLDRFRDASKALYKYLEGFTWSKKVEKLGFDEVFLDVTDIISYNQALLNFNDLSHSFFQLSEGDPTIGFSFDAMTVAGHAYPEVSAHESPLEMEHSDLLVRLILGSHLAQNIRHKLVEEKDFPSTIGISTSKLLAKLVGNLHKPIGQTTLMPPYERFSPSMENPKIPGPFWMPDENATSNVTLFIDSHEIGKIPGIGFKMSHKIRSHVLARPAIFEDVLPYDGTKEYITVGDVRCFPGMGPELLDKLLGGPGSERDIGIKTWRLINGIDDSEVKRSKKIPSQISIEDSYIRLDSVAQVYRELRMLGTSLLKRMHVDLLEDDEDLDILASAHPVDFGKADLVTSVSGKRWIAHPKTIRLSTRARPPTNADGTRGRSFNRISRSGPLPNFVFSLHEGLDVLVEKLVQETLVPMFHRLHPQKHGWNLSLMNVGVTNMTEIATVDGTGRGRHIGRMFKHQQETLKEWKVEDKGAASDGISDVIIRMGTGAETERPDALLHELRTELSTSNDAAQCSSRETLYSRPPMMDEEIHSLWEDDGERDGCNQCQSCGASMPAFAMTAHQLYHTLGDDAQ